MTTSIVPQSKIGIEIFQLNELRLPVIMLHFSGIKSVNFLHFSGVWRLKICILAEFRHIFLAF